MKSAQKTNDSQRTKRRRTLTQKLTYDQDLPADIVDALWQGPVDRLVASSRPLQVKDNTVVVLHSHSTGRFLLKRHIWGDLSRTLRKMYRAPTARRCASIGGHLATHGIPTPRPRAHVEHCLGPFTYRSYLLTDFVEGQSLFDLLRSGPLATARAAHLARQVAEIWQRLVDLNISHNDLKPENFVVDESDHVWLIDLEKVRSHRKPDQLRYRHLEDARIFLHVRNWRDQLEAAEIFRQELLRTSLNDWAPGSHQPDHTLFRSGYSPAELAARISVGIVAENVDPEDAEVRRTARSVRDMADEIAIVGPADDGNGLKVRRLLSAASPGDIQSTKLQHPWVLVLHAGECATPDLVRELPEQIADEPQCEAVRVLIEQVYSGRPAQLAGKPEPAPVRAFRQDRCRVTLRSGELSVDVDPGHTVLLPRKIQTHVCESAAEHLDERNEQSAETVPTALQKGEPPISKAA